MLQLAQTVAVTFLNRDNHEDLPKLTWTSNPIHMSVKMSNKA